MLLFKPPITMLGDTTQAWTWLAYVGAALLLAIVAYELLRGRMQTEGFTDGVLRDAPAFFARHLPRRVDVGPGTLKEEDGYLRNARFAEGYVDLQRLGYEGDFCRVVEKPGDEGSRMLVCALAGTEGLDSMTYRTTSQRGGTLFSRDDYLRDVTGDGRASYCRIVPRRGGSSNGWEARCIRGGLTRFDEFGASEPVDASPPTPIADLLWFYEGVMAWYRFIDDGVDCTGNSRLALAGGAAVDEATPKRTPQASTPCKGLELNAVPDGGYLAVRRAADQFARLGENDALEFDSRVKLRDLRALSLWVRFDEFTNNAHVLDFGNGAGLDNVWLGIEGRGNAPASVQGGAVEGGEPRTSAAGPAFEGGAACLPRAPEVSPQLYLRTSEADVDALTCPGAPPQETLVPPPFAAQRRGDAAPTEPTAHLLFEVWDGPQRKMRVRVLDAVPLRRWVHITITATDLSPRPSFDVYVDGTRVHTHEGGHLPLKSFTTRNYLGRSNWEEATAEFADSDERFRGALFDLRLYAVPLSEARIARTVAWGRRWLEPKA